MARPTNQQSAATRQDAWSPNWGSGFVLPELWIDLPPRITLLRDLRKMVLMDETAGAMQFCVNSVVGGMGWRHLACVDGHIDEKDPAAIAAARFADTLMKDMRLSWAEFLMQAMSITWAGVSPFEIVMKRRDGFGSKFNDGAWGVDRLVQIDPNTITKWDTDENGQIIGVTQMQSRGAMPIWKVLHVRTHAYLNNPWGEALLTPAWRVWKLKKRVQDSEAMGIERELVGLPLFRMPQDVLDTASEVIATGQPNAGQPTADALKAQAIVTAAMKAVSETRLGPTNGLVLPSNTYSEDDDQITDRTPKYDFKLVTSGGQRTIDARTVARDHDRAIMRVIMMQFLALGDRAGGSYALSDDQSSMMVKAMVSLATLPAEQWNAKVLPLAWNLAGKDPRFMPQLTCGEVSKEGLTAIGAFLRGLGAVEKLWTEDEKARSSALRMAGIDFDRDAQAASTDTAREVADLAANPPPAPTPVIRPPAAANANKGARGAEDEDDDNGQVG